MKTFKNIAALCMALLCTSGASSFANKAVTNAHAPTTDNCNCDNNVLKNPSFEDSKTFDGWKGDGEWQVSTTYDVCGNRAVALDGKGKIYQDVPVAPGTKVDFSVYGGVHVNKDQEFRLLFYNSSNESLAGADGENIDFTVGNGSSLRKYFLSAVAPAGTAYARVEARSVKGGDWIKMDGACVQLTIPAPVCCTVNKLSNGSFEEYKLVGDRKVPKDWNYSNNSNFSWDGAFAVCGKQSGLLTGAGSFWQDVAITAGSSATLSIWGGYHEKNSQVFKLQFVLSNGDVVEGDSKALTKSVSDLPKTSNVGLTQYDLSAIAPSGAKYVRVFGSSNGNYLKVDAACLTISVPVCETCNDNKMTDPSFEAGTSEWTKAGGTFETSNDYVVCGTKSGKLTGKSTLSLEKSADPAATVTFSIYAGVSSVNGQKLRLRFLNADRGEISSKETPVTKIYSAPAVGLQKFTVSERAPQNTRFVSVELVSNGETFIFDLGCLSIAGGTPLPVTLTEFGVKKEGISASLVWKTTMETNSKEFEVQHSSNGKQWEILGVVAAQGESSVTKSYNFLHTTPANGNNLYRLRMIDQDLTFAYSRIVNENFVTEESAVLYPNPSSNFMKLKTVEKIASIQIYDVKGIKVKDFSPSGTDIDISSLAQGTYIVTFKQTSGLVTKQRIQVVR
ncbi:T9SS type A sorting domain-containing protein [Dyadobacter sp. CY345]|uniref:T9SS type A sorting domain-containing protein n=1 Tax=Dyadobacter sp. CY345 TaxID=2909335 RepID=UPI001F294445|nr:T9SS type A sorting domain-containing protein [Dyadobacter sp. CY345]MCF2442882.1 T9SS type A sorting domain-containing protein [Dyadobacter sp. CY345]